MPKVEAPVLDSAIKINGFVLADVVRVRIGGLEEEVEVSILSSQQHVSR